MLRFTPNNSQAGRLDFSANVRAVMSSVIAGQDGDPGQDGSAATVTVGSVTTLNPGDPATVVNVGTTNAAVFNFGIPPGADGTAGVEEFLDHGEVSSGTETLDRDVAIVHRIKATGNFALAVSNWPPNAVYGEILVEAADFGAHTVDLSIVDVYLTYDGNAPSFQTSGTDYFVLFTRDGGSTVTLAIKDYAPGTGSGDVTAASSFGTDNRLIRSDGTGKGVQSSGITIDDSNNMSGVGGGAFTAAITITAANPYFQLTDTDTNADCFVGGNNSTGSFELFADYFGEAANSAHNWFIDDASTVRMQLTTSSLNPGVSDSKSLGTSSVMWSDAFFASGAVVNFNNGDVTLTHSADTITLAGGMLVLPASGLQIGSSNPFSDSTGTLTLQNVDALDATTESTIEAAIDTLANLTSIQGVSFTFGAYAATLLNNANEAAFKAAVNLEAGTDFYSVSGANAAFQPLDSDLTAIAALTTTAAGRSALVITDPNVDRIMAWDDSAGGQVPIALADLTDEGSPATGDYLLIYGAEGDLRKADWSTLPSGGGGSGDVTAASTFGTDNTIIRADGTGKGVQTSLVVIDDTTGTIHTTTNDLGALGTTSIGWSDVHLATGALINVANGDAVITHSTGIFTVSTGDLRVTTAGTNAASVVTVGGTQELASKTLNASVGKGTWTASGTWTLPAFTLGGAVTGGSQNISALGTIGSGAITVTATSASSLAVGRQGATDPVLKVDASTGSVATGISITGAAAAGGVALAAISSGTNEALKIDAKGSGTITVGGTSTGAITLTRATTMSAALTYGGVTLSNAVTGTGNMVLATSPTLTTPVLGTPSSGTLTNCSGLPAAGLVASTSQAVGFGTIELGHASDTTIARSAAGLITVESVAVAMAGKQTIFIPASAMVARTTNGAAAGSAEMSSNKNMFKTLDFDTSTQEFAQFEVFFPKSWNLGTVTFLPLWSHASTTTNFGVVWALQGVARSNDDAGDVAFGTEQTSTDTGGTTNDIYMGPESSAITIAGTPAAGDSVQFQVKRVPSNGSDTMAIDARLHGIQLFLTTNAANDS